MYLKRLLRRLQAATLNLSWPALFLLLLLHAGSSWGLMGLANEEVSHSLVRWLYFYVTTATTIGYGDWSPATETGQMIAVFWLMPGSIMLFASFIGKTATLMTNKWRGVMCGKASYSDLSGHTLIIGWHGEPTEAMVSILLQDPQFSDDIVLCVVTEMENPLPGKVRFVRGESFSNPSLLDRAGINGADRIIIYDYSEERVATIAMSVYRLKHPDCHVVAHCGDRETANMLREALPGIECTQGLSIEMLVRSATDRGSSRVVNELLALDHGATQFQYTLPRADTTFGELFQVAKAEANVTLLGLEQANTQPGQGLLNPCSDTRLAQGDVIYYMGRRRLTEGDWQGLLT